MGFAVISCWEGACNVVIFVKIDMNGVRYRRVFIYSFWQ